MKLALVTLLTLTTSIGAMAQGVNERVQLRLNEHYRGQTTLPLKRLLRQQRPGLDLAGVQLKAVTLVAKSKQGRGEAVLDVGQFSSYPTTIAGSPGVFHRDGPRTFSRVRMQNPSYNSRGKWQVQLRGNIKVKKVVLVIQKRQIVRDVRLVVRQQFQGQSVLPLKRMLQAQNPGLNIANFEIQRVAVVAKSRRGRGQASLVVGHSAGYPSTVGGGPRAYNSNHPSTFQVVHLEAPYRAGSTGKWQVQLRGNIKVKEVVLTLKSKSEPDNGGFGGGRGNRGGRRGL